MDSHCTLISKPWVWYLIIIWIVQNSYDLLRISLDPLLSYLITEYPTFIYCFLKHQSFELYYLYMMMIQIQLLKNHSYHIFWSIFQLFENQLSDALSLHNGQVILSFHCRGVWYAFLVAELLTDAVPECECYIFQCTFHLDNLLDLILHWHSFWQLKITADWKYISFLKKKIIHLLDNIFWHLRYLQNWKRR